MKTNELSGTALDWAVAMADGWQPEKVNDDRGEYWWLFKDGEGKNPKQYRPSSNWIQGGPIIERERLSLLLIDKTGGWAARTEAYPPAYVQGETPLIAAMRCYVASKLGDEVQIPEGL